MVVEEVVVVERGCPCREILLSASDSPWSLSPGCGTLRRNRQEKDGLGWVALDLGLEEN